MLAKLEDLQRKANACKWEGPTNSDWAYSNLYHLKIDCMLSALNGKDYVLTSDDYVDFKYCPYCGRETELEET